MKVKERFFDPLYGYLEKGQHVPNDAYGHRLLKAGKVAKDEPAKTYETKVVRNQPKGATNAKRRKS